MKVINTKVEKTENILPQYLGTFFSRMRLQISISLGLKRLFFLAVQKNPLYNPSQTGDFFEERGREGKGSHSH